MSAHIYRLTTPVRHGVSKHMFTLSNARTSDYSISRWRRHCFRKSKTESSGPAETSGRLLGLPISFDSLWANTPPGQEMNPDAAFELSINNHGTLYINETTNRASQYVYLLPLENSSTSIVGRLVERQCDPKLLRKWVECCQEWHGSDCYTPGRFEVITPLSKMNQVRMIDLQRGCLTLAPAGCRYVVLSYVWGKAKMFKTTRANVAALHQVNGVNATLHAFPATIVDAMKLVTMMGERYLWVDSICIVQDDPQEKHSQVANMDAIYGNAVLTINAAAGEDANAGLPGIGPSSRKVVQTIFEYQPGRRLIVAQPILTDIADASSWNTRAWTYQERFLSKRCITFTDQHVFFQCQRVLWCEDVAAEDEKIIDHHQMEDYLPVDWSSERNDHMYKLHYTLHLQRSPNWVEYLRTVEEYTPRTMSFETDALAAFAGMSKVLGAMFRSELLYGLPEVLFDCALLWQPAGTLVRRQMPKLAASANDPCFPSWSWAGWKGMIVYEDIMPHLKMLSSELVRRTKPLVKWQKQTADQSLTTPIATAGELGRYLLETFEDDLPEGWHVSTGGMFDIFTGAYYYHDDSPSNFFAIPPLLTTAPKQADDLRWPRIVGTVSSALLHITPAPESGSIMGNTRRFNINDLAGLWCGSVWLDDAWSAKTAQKHEFIVLSEGCTPKGEIERFWSTEEWSAVIGDDNTSWYHYFNVLLIEREGTISFRVGIGKVDKARWSSLPTVEVNICLA